MWYSKGVEGLQGLSSLFFLIMSQFKITYGVGGGYNDISEQIIEAANLNEAEQIAYELAVEVFDSYSIYEEQDMGEEYDESEYQDSIERWIDYSAEAV
jgi:hypothetical protein